MLSFFVGFLIGGVTFLLTLIGGAEILFRKLAIDWDLEKPIRIVNNKEARNE